MAKNRFHVAKTDLILESMFLKYCKINLIKVYIGWKYKSSQSDYFWKINYAFKDNGIQKNAY